MGATVSTSVSQSKAVTKAAVNSAVAPSVPNLVTAAGVAAAETIASGVHDPDHTLSRRVRHVRRFACCCRSLSNAICPTAAASPVIQPTGKDEKSVDVLLQVNHSIPLTFVDLCRAATDAITPSKVNGVEHWQAFVRFAGKTEEHRVSQPHWPIAESLLDPCRFSGIVFVFVQQSSPPSPINASFAPLLVGSTTTESTVWSKQVSTLTRWICNQCSLSFGAEHSMFTTVTKEVVSSYCRRCQQHHAQLESAQLVAQNAQLQTLLIQNGSFYA